MKKLLVFAEGLIYCLIIYLFLAAVGAAGFLGHFWVRVFAVSLSLSVIIYLFRQQKVSIDTLEMENLHQQSKLEELEQRIKELEAQETRQ